jgi:hypothetical protein
VLRHEAAVAIEVRRVERGLAAGPLPTRILEPDMKQTLSKINSKKGRLQRSMPCAACAVNYRFDGTVGKHINNPGDSANVRQQHQTISAF